MELCAQDSITNLLIVVQHVEKEARLGALCTGFYNKPLDSRPACGDRGLELCAEDPTSITHLLVIVVQLVRVQQPLRVAKDLAHGLRLHSRLLPRYLVHPLQRVQVGDKGGLHPCQYLQGLKPKSVTSRARGGKYKPEEQMP